MVVSALLILYGLLLSYLTGQHTFALLIRLSGNKQYPGFHSALFPILGMATMSLFVAVYHLFFPVDVYLHVFFLSWVLASAKRNVDLLRTAWVELKQHTPAYLILFIGALLAVISRPGSGDIADYHLQAIKWAEAFPNVPGLGNFNRPLSNNNWWFNLQAFLGAGFLGVGSVYVGNAIFFLSAGAYFLFSHVASKARQWMRFVFALFIILSLKTAFVGAVTPDFVVTLTLYILMDLYLRYNENEEHQNIHLWLMVFLMCWILTVKATAISFGMMALPALYDLLRQRRFDNLLRLMIMPALFLLPWIMGNIIVSGYVLYPFHQINLFSFDWKVPEDMLKWETFSIRNWGKVPGQDVAITARMSIYEWFPIWFGNLDILNKSLLLLFVVCTPFIWLLSIKKKNILWLCLFLLSGFLLIFLNGPHPRFLFAYMVGTIAIAAYYMADRMPMVIRNSYLVVLSGFMLAFLAWKTFSDGSLAFGWFHPKPYPHEKIEVIQMGDFHPMVTKLSNTCWDQFPCTYYMVDSTELRTGDVRDGFRVKR